MVDRMAASNEAPGDQTLPCVQRGLHNVGEYSERCLPDHMFLWSQLAFQLLQDSLELQPSEVVSAFSKYCKNIKVCMFSESLTLAE